MFLPPDHFQLFQLAPRFALDLAALDRAYRSVQAQVHPDRFAAGTAAENRVAMQWATQANEAYRTLKSPLKRAAYLCERASVPIDAESNTAMPSEFLMQQLQWREALDGARGQHDSAALQALDDGMASERDRLLGEIGHALDVEGNHPRAASLVRQLMFIEKFGTEIFTAVEALRDSRASA
ncbi:MAG TPA: Fe-S protein assembly co-chaperone HscB [Burkholderiaceae bacterium]|nr:Fe-S protein assembly co-chaperone HscB [Burkholderiaceae bacterium]